MTLRELTPEVFYALGAVPRVSRETIDLLKQRAGTSPRGRVRVCAHPGTEDRLHEMVIVLRREGYVRPHRHVNKSESAHVIEGDADLLLFDEHGSVSDVVQVGDYRSGKPFFYRIHEPLFHTFLIRTECFVFHEVTGGPLRREDSEFAAWSPAEDSPAAVAKYLQHLEAEVARRGRS